MNTLQEKLLKIVNENTDPDYLDILSTAEIAKLAGIKTSEAYPILVKLSNEDKIFYFEPVNDDHFSGANWSKVGTIDGEVVTVCMRHF